MVREFSLQDVVRLRKGHPCGSDQWEIVRLGADIGLRCLGCGRRVLLERSALERRLREHRPAAASGKEADSVDSPGQPA